MTKVTGKPVHANTLRHSLITRLDDQSKTGFVPNNTLLAYAKAYGHHVSTQGEYRRRPEGAMSTDPTLKAADSLMTSRKTGS